MALNFCPKKFLCTQTVCVHMLIKFWKLFYVDPNTCAKEDYVDKYIFWKSIFCNIPYT